MGNLGNLGKLGPNALISLELSSSIILIYEPVNLLSRMGSINYFTPVVQKILYTYFRNYLRNNIPTWKPFLKTQKLGLQILSPLFEIS